MRKGYRDIKAGEWIQPKMRGYRLACCDCGLVHQMDFRIAGSKVQMRFFRNNKSTAAIRRWMKIRKE